VAGTEIGVAFSGVQQSLLQKPACLPPSISETISLMDLALRWEWWTTFSEKVRTLFSPDSRRI